MISYADISGTTNAHSLTPRTHGARSLADARERLVRFPAFYRCIRVEFLPPPALTICSVHIEPEHRKYLFQMDTGARVPGSARRLCQQYETENRR